jgi:hypothetical protein
VWSIGVILFALMYFVLLLPYSYVHVSYLFVCCIHSTPFSTVTCSNLCA